MSKELPAKSAAAAGASDINALLMRAIATELTQRIIPELKSADAIERANFARLILLNMATDIDLLPPLAAKALPALAKAAGLDAVPGSSSQDDVAALRDHAAAAIRRIADGTTDSSSAARLEALGRWDAQWVIDYDAACSAQGKPAGAASAPGATPAAELVTVDSVTQYLRRRFPENPAIRATDVTSIPGGRSKKTFFVTVDGETRLPRDIVIRQDYALKYAGTQVADEYLPLVTLSGLGLPVPKPLLLEREVSEIGPPFMFVNRLSGKPPGSYFGMTTTCPGAFRELAAFLARLHQVEPQTLGFAPKPASTDNLLTLLAQYRSKWRDNATRSSPVVDFAYAWAEHQCGRDAGSTAFVHGDAGPYNFLVENDRLTAILDWEFAHVGDPAEDLGVARIYSEGSLPWAEFLSIYTQAGGLEVSENRIQLGMLIQFLKGTTLVAASGRNFKEGGTHEFIKGANAFTGLRLIELRIAQLLKRFGAV